MSRLEEIMYEAYELGIQNEVYDKVRELRVLPPNKFAPLSDIYEQAFAEITKKIKELD